MRDDQTNFVINNIQDDACRICGSRECKGCGCTWCNEHKAVYFDIPDQFGRPEQLCAACYAVRIAELPHPNCKCTSAMPSID